jgi:exosortase A-associated hydrolase 1
MNETPIVFESRGLPLVGMLHHAEGNPQYGILVIVAGGPQYRIGGHRQLVLWARIFAAIGFPVLRFDFAGMGDSYGSYSGFEDAEGDLRAAIDRFFVEYPSLKGVILWGECNACSASLFYAHKDPRVTGIVMLNPWVRTEEGQAKAVVRHYYLNRLMQRSFWAKVLGLKFNVFTSLRSAVQMFSTAFGRGGAKRANTNDDSMLSQGALPDRMLYGLSRFKGEVMLVMSGRDMVAKEFDDLIAAMPAWKKCLADRNTVRHDLPYADHTFSTAEWRDQVGQWGVEWLKPLRQLESHSAACES